MEKHVNHVSRTCHTHLHNIGRIRRFLTGDEAKILVHALIMSQLDYANALLLSASDYLIARLQRIQNAAARLITRTPRREHVTPDLINLHWLPVRNRMEYKILTQVLPTVTRVLGLQHLKCGTVCLCVQPSVDCFKKSLKTTCNLFKNCNGL